MVGLAVRQVVHRNAALQAMESNRRAERAEPGGRHGGRGIQRHAARGAYREPGGDGEGSALEQALDPAALA